MNWLNLITFPMVLLPVGKKNVNYLNTQADALHNCCISIHQSPSSHHFFEFSKGFNKNLNHTTSSWKKTHFNLFWNNNIINSYRLLFKKFLLELFYPAISTKSPFGMEFVKQQNLNTVFRVMVHAGQEITVPRCCTFPGTWFFTIILDKPSLERRNLQESSVPNCYIS